jgi:hypothetical protein
MLKLTIFIIGLVMVNKLFKVNQFSNEIDQAILDELKIIK